MLWRFQSKTETMGKVVLLQNGYSEAGIYCAGSHLNTYRVAD